MNKLISFFVLNIMVCSCLLAQEHTVSSPDKNLVVNVFLKNGSPGYSVAYKGKTMLEDSPLGLQTDIGDYSRNLSCTGYVQNGIDETYALDRTKTSHVHYVANELVVSFQNGKKQSLEVVFRVSNHDVAFRYRLPQYDGTTRLVVEKELSGFDFPAYTTTFLTQQARPNTGWKQTKPSYEEEYTNDEPVGNPTLNGQGYTFPGLFRIGNDGWVLLCETGVNGTYCGSRLSEGTREGLYTVAFPDPEENGGIGNAAPVLSLPGETPWRTITVGENLKPIVETTVMFDVVKPLFAPSIAYGYGRSVWSWIMWQDNSINYEDQMRYINMAAAMGYEYSLVDNWWDTKIGRERIEELAAYARSKNVGLLLWYNSNGCWNDAPQGPKHCMNTAKAREKEMSWLRKIGVKGIKVDFFGGDKQETMQLYEDILSDANRFGLTVIFHGTTIPRGWERMYPNYVGSEAVLASENLVFSQRANDREAFNATLHPFIRNTIGCMEFGPVLLNRYHDRENAKGKIRKTTDIFQLATGILFQNPIQAFALAPNNLTDVPEFEIRFMKDIPTTWDEIRFIDGYPGRYVILARRHKDRWYVAAINAEKKALTLKANLEMLAGASVMKYYDDGNRRPKVEKVKIGNSGIVSLDIQPEGGIVFVKE